MIERKTVSLNDLKYYYDGRHGFVFTPASDKYADVVGQVILNKGVSNKLPEFITTLENATIFVYPEDCKFASGDFYQYVQSIPMHGMMFKIDILSAFLKAH